eukprot:GSA25T00021850001.1
MFFDALDREGNGLIDLQLLCGYVEPGTTQWQMASQMSTKLGKVGGLKRIGLLDKSGALAGAPTPSKIGLVAPLVPGGAAAAGSPGGAAGVLPSEAPKKPAKNFGTNLMRKANGVAASPTARDGDAPGPGKADASGDTTGKADASSGAATHHAITINSTASVVRGGGSDGTTTVGGASSGGGLGKLGDGSGNLASRELVPRDFYMPGEDNYGGVDPEFLYSPRSSGNGSVD